MNDDTGLVRLGAAVFGAMVVIGAIARLLGVDPKGHDGGGDDPPAAQALLGDTLAAADTLLDCELDAPPVELPAAVHEASGLALSRRMPGLLWTHSDAGDPQVLAVDSSGTMRGSVRLTGATVVNWEDLAVGPCPAGTCLYVADIGDNEASRPEITIYRLPEPDPTTTSAAPAEALQASYPDGRHDAEAMFVDAAGRIHVVTKGETGSIAVYRFPEDAAPGRAATLERLAVLSDESVRRPERITGASASADGRLVALRTLTSLAIYPVAALTSGPAADAQRFDVAAADEAQGEGVALGEGGIVYLASEGGSRKKPATLARMTCPLR